MARKVEGFSMFITNPTVKTKELMAETPKEQIDHKSMFDPSIGNPSKNWISQISYTAILHYLY